jgi:hypothetical protein
MNVLKSAILLTHTETDKHGLLWSTMKISASVESSVSAAIVLFLLEQDEVTFHLYWKENKANVNFSGRY